ncbi:MAG: trypsin-like peptidase domain-containing protein [Candidatus Marithrix sp.]
MPKPTLNHAVIRILIDDQEPCQAVGAGFLVSPRHFLTCAHVINDALRLPKDTSDIPEETVYLDFPLLPKHHPLQAKVHKWFAVKESNAMGEFEDICVLELVAKTPLPKQAQPVPIVVIESNAFFDRAVRTFGFPVGRDDGDWLNGVLHGTISNGWVQLESEVGRRGVAPGFSGTAVWDKAENAVAGMMVSIHTGTVDTAAYMIPVVTLINAWAELNQHSRPANPYRGLAAFREEDVDNYFGREDTVQELVKLVDKQIFTAIIGASGSGKSSIVFAGLVPQLRKTDAWIIIDFKPRNQPFNELALALVPLLYSDELEQAKKLTSFAQDLATGAIGLSQIVQLIIRKQPHKRLLLLVDQFEELYTLNPRETQQSFVACLLQAVNDLDNSLHLVFTMRADFMGQATEDELFSQALDDYDNKILGPMSVANLRAAIENPAEKQQVKLEDGLTDRILHDLGDSPGNLPLLEFALTELWERMERGRLSHDTFAAIGGVKEALSHHADEFYAQLDAENQAKLRKIFIQLVRPGEGTEDTRQVATREFVGEGNWDLVVQMADARLVVTGHESGKDTVEVVHEALIRSWQPLRDWMSQDRQFRVWQNNVRQSVRDWDDDGALLRGSRLIEAEEFLRERVDEVSGKVKEFIEASLVARQKQVRLRGVVTVGLTMLLVISLLAGGVAWWKWLEAEEKTLLAEEKTVLAQEQTDEALKTQSLFLADLSQQQTDNGSTTNGILLALEGLPKNMSEPDRPHVFEAEQKLYHAVLNHSELKMSEQLILEGDNSLNDTSFSPNGKMIATTENDSENSGTVRIWDASNGKLLHTLIGHPNFVHRVIFSPNSLLLATTSYNGNVLLWEAEIRLWEAKTGKLLHVLTKQKYRPTDIIFSPDNLTLATASYQSNIANLWQVKTGKLIRTFIGHESGGISDITFSPDGLTLATASFGDKTARLWNVETGKLLHTLIGHKEGAVDVTFSPDGLTLVTASFDKTARLWEVKTGKLFHILTGHEDTIDDQKFTYDGLTLATASYDKTIRLWEVKTGKLLHTLTGHIDRIRHIAFNSNGLMLATASFDKTAHMWDVETGKLLHILAGHKGIVRSVEFSPDDMTLITVSETIRMWNVETNDYTLPEVKDIKFKSDDLFLIYDDAIYSPNSMTSAVISGKTVKLWNIETDKLLHVLSHKNDVENILYSPNGQILATMSNETINLWKTETGKLLYSITGHEFNSGNPIFSPDGLTLAIATSDKVVQLWKVKTGELLHTFQYEKDINDFVFSPNSLNLAIVSNKTVSLREIKTGKSLNSFLHEDDIYSIKFSPNSQILVTTFWANYENVLLWNVETGKLLHTLSGHEEQIRNIVFSPNGKKLVTTTNEYVRIWKIKTGELIDTIYDFIVDSVVFSPDGLILAIINNGTTGLWMVETGKFFYAFESETYDSSGDKVLFSSDDSILSIVSKDGVRLLPLFSTQALIDEANKIVPRCLSIEQRKQFFLPNSKADELMIEGKDLASEGKIEEAIVKFNQAKELASCFKFEPESKAIRIASTSFLETGKELAKQGKIEKAIIEFNRAIKIDSRVKLASPKSFAQGLAQQEAKYLIDQGRELARIGGKYESAIAKFKEAKILDSSLTFEPEDKTQAIILVEQGEVFAKEGKIIEAINNYKQAQQMDSDVEIYSWEWDALCKYGSLHGYADKVIEYCEKAVELYFDDKDLIDSRALARALTGNIQGAIEDFKFVIKNSDDKEFKSKRQSWLDSLQKGENPFTDEVLEGMR